MACAAAYLNHGDVGDVRNAIRNMGKTMGKSMGKLGKTDCNWPFHNLFQVKEMPRGQAHDTQCDLMDDTINNATIYNGVDSFLIKWQCGCTTHLPSFINSDG